MTIASISLIAAWAIGGVALGWLHFLLLRVSVERMVRESQHARFFGVAAVRIAATAGVFMLAMWCGTPSLLAVASGFLIGRTLFVGRSSTRPAAAP